MADIWEKLANTAESFALIGSPNVRAARQVQMQQKQSDLNEILTKIQMAGGIHSPAGRAIAETELIKNPAFTELKQKVGGQDIFRPQLGGVFGGLGDMQGYEPSYTMDESGGLKTTYKPVTPSPSKEVGKYMQGLSPGSESWKEAAKFSSAQVNISPASASEREAIAGGRASLDALDNLKSLFDSKMTKTGLIAGRIEPVKGLFGLSSKEQEDLMAATYAFKNAIIKEITGAQMSEAEAQRIMKQIPDITDPPTRWLAKWEQSKKNLEMLQKRRLEIIQQSGLRVPSVMPNQQTPQFSAEEIEAELKRRGAIK